jgi:hypothetical protein
MPTDIRSRQLCYCNNWIHKPNSPRCYHILKTCPRVELRSLANYSTDLNILNKPGTRSERFYIYKVGTQPEFFFLNLRFTHPRLRRNSLYPKFKQNTLKPCHKQMRVFSGKRVQSWWSNLQETESASNGEVFRPDAFPLQAHFTVFCASRWSNGYITVPYHSVNNGRFVFSLSIVLLLYVFLQCDVIQTLALFL